MSRSRRSRPGRAPAPAVRVRRRRARPKRGRKLALVLVLLAVVLVAAGIAAGGAVLAFGSKCDLDALRPTRIGQNTFVYAADGSLLGVIPAERNREVVALGKMSPWLRQATVAIEDRRFYDHGGIDAEGIARALWRDIKAGEVVEGGSTITQQLVRNLYISNERTVQRKVTEACLAVKLDDAWSKQKILGSYLNSVFYGNLAYGAEAASRTYFSRTARTLTLPQAALVAGLPQAPTTYDPLTDPVRARQRRDQVLDAMLQESMITPAQHRWARRQPIGLRPGRLYEQIREPYFFGYVRDQLVKAYGAETVRSGGLKVYTTIEPRWQRLAQKAIADTLTRKADPAAAIVSIDPANGAIRAMTAIVPGRANNQFNLLSQARRQPGSTFKTFVLAAAVERGMDPSSTYYVSAPFTYRPRADGNCDDGSWWCVRTYDSSYTGWTSVERATLRSDNSVYAQLTLDVGPARVASMARRLGVRTPLQVNGAFPPAMGLGSVAVSPLDMASAYATLAAGGIYTEPTAIRRVILNGKRDDRWAAHHRRTRVVPDGVASVVTRILEDNVRYGTGTAAALNRPVAGKTGTTDKHADAWFVGFTPGLSTAVWMGYTRGEVPMTNVHGISVSGGSFPAQIWRRFMDPALAGLSAREFPEPAQPVVFQQWHRGPSALSYDPYYVAPPSAPTTTQEETTTPPPPKDTSPKVSATPAQDAAPSPAAATRAPVPEAPPRTAAALPSRDLQVGAARRGRRHGLSRRDRVGHGVARRLAARSAGGRSRRAGTARLFLALVAAAFVAYLAGLVLLRRRSLALRAAILVAAGVQLVPLAAPLLLSTDAWTYWGYGWIAAEGGGNPYVDPPSAFPESPAAPYLGADWRDTTSVYGPAFTLVSEPVARIAGSSADAAAWLFKSLAALAVLVATVAVSRSSRRPALAAAFVGWNPVLAIHAGGGGHNDALVGALVATAVALGAHRRSSASGAVWALAALFKWVPLVFFALAALAARARGSSTGALVIVATLVAGGAVATWRYGLHWLGALGPLAENAVRRTSYALPSRLEQLGLPHGVALGIAFALLAAGLAWLARDALAGRARLGSAACLVLATTPYLAVWYLAWAVPLAAPEDDDRLARLAALGLTAYLLPQTIPH